MSTEAWSAIVTLLCTTIIPAVIAVLQRRARKDAEARASLLEEAHAIAVEAIERVNSAEAREAAKTLAKSTGKYEQIKALVNAVKLERNGDAP